MLFLKKLLLFLFCFSVFALVVILVEPPLSWEQASYIQILAFFIPLLLTLTFLINLFLSYMPHSFIISLGIMMLLVFYSIKAFNFVTAPSVLVITISLIKFFPKLRYSKFSKTPYIPNLGLSNKENKSKLSRSRRRRPRIY
jgi:hypothetical protein